MFFVFLDEMFVFRLEMRKAALLLAWSVVVCLLWSSGEAARQGQDMRCGGTYVSASLSSLLTVQSEKVLTFPSSAACRALVDEMEWAISQVDPKKMIQTGSFRINPDGSQSIREVRLQRLSHVEASVQPVWSLHHHADVSHSAACFAFTQYFEMDFDSHNQLIFNQTFI